MAPLRIIHGLKSRSKQPKAVTPRQQELVKQLKRDLERSEKANAKLQERLAQRARYHSPPPGYDGPNPDDIPGPPQFDDQAGSDNEDKREGDYVIDPDHFMPWQEANHANDAVLAGLRREQHLGNRLKHETRWAWQYAIMLPTFLRCRLETSNWGNPRRWNHDFWGPCNCPKKTERDVDLVDVLS
ncbi:uncharacterized protein MELLADRAFT_109914 [Melampsora larici-populina 98AG31]|uniref:Uncharacterized protein n=1 Tax=Melampsora larici-populina (strain 98AG31 / pathotype 3-4-7) TaxID=747676 RepID=F4RY21_MELLP|nr:uncharacterized protein MELLADRAFT_109914 [Melampsora larici-populina 98AG31]EGG02719.1 hypothetical protein MELLADRAFT_109914 [Melampsora larici-populina 98AG31]